MPRVDSPIIRPSSHFKKLNHEQVCSLIKLLLEVDASTEEKDRLDVKEKEALSVLEEIRDAMEDKRAREDAEARRRRK